MYFVDGFTLAFFISPCFYPFLLTLQHAPDDWLRIKGTIEDEGNFMSTLYTFIDGRIESGQSPLLILIDVGRMRTWLNPIA